MAVVGNVGDVGVVTVWGLGMVNCAAEVVGIDGGGGRSTPMSDGSGGPSGICSMNLSAKCFT